MDTFDWEYAKENARPLREGYKLSKLNQALSCGANRPALLQEQT